MKRECVVWKRILLWEAANLLAVMAIHFKLVKIICFGQYDMNDVSLGNKSWYYETLEDADEGNGPICYM